MKPDPAANVRRCLDAVPRVRREHWDAKLSPTLPTYRDYAEALEAVCSAIQRAAREHVCEIGSCGCREWDKVLSMLPKEATDAQ